MPSDVSQADTTPSARRRRGEARVYDFRRPVRLAREHNHLLKVAMQTFARQTTTVLTSSLRAVSSVSLPVIEELSYDEFLGPASDQTVCAVLSIPPWHGKALLTFEQGALLAMVDHQLGGMGSENQPERPLTDLEQALLRQLITRILHELSFALETIAKGVQVQLIALEPDIRFVQAAAATDPVVVCQMELSVGKRESILNLCLPYTMLAPALELATRKDDPDTNRLRDAALAQTQRRLTAVDVEVSVRLEPTSMSSRDILQLKVGDVVPFPHPTASPVAVTSAAAVFARAVPGASGRNLAVLIVSGR